MDPRRGWNNYGTRRSDSTEEEDAVHILSDAAAAKTQMGIFACPHCQENLGLYRPLHSSLLDALAHEADGNWEDPSDSDGE